MSSFTAGDRCVMATMIAMQLCMIQLPHLALGCETFVLCQSVPVCTLLLADMCWQLQAGPVLNATKCQVSTCCAGCRGSEQRNWLDNARHTPTVAVTLQRVIAGACLLPEPVQQIFCIFII